MKVRRDISLDIYRINIIMVTIKSMWRDRIPYQNISSWKAFVIFCFQDHKDINIICFLQSLCVPKLDCLYAFLKIILPSFHQDNRVTGWSIWSKTWITIMVSVKAVRYSNVFLTNLLCAKTSFFRLPLRIVFKTVIQSLNCMKIAESLVNVFEAKLESKSWCQ